MELALRLGCTLEECMDRVSAPEFYWWRAFDKISPIGDRRMEIMLAQIAQVLAEVNRNKKKRSKPWQVDDFIPNWSGQPKQRQKHWKELLSIAENLNQAFGGKDERKNGH